MQSCIKYDVEIFVKLLFTRALLNMQWFMMDSIEMILFNYNFMDLSCPISKCRQVAI